jgi:hypothetical protein
VHHLGVLPLGRVRVVLLCSLFYIYVNNIKASFISVSFIIVIAQFQVTVATNCRMLTHCVNVSYVVCHERASSVLLQCALIHEYRYFFNVYVYNVACCREEKV